MNTHLFSNVVTKTISGLTEMVKSVHRITVRVDRSGVNVL